MSSALLKYATKKTAKPTAVVAEPVAAAASGPSILGGGDGSAEAGGLGVKIADVSTGAPSTRRSQSTLTEEEEFKRKREQDAARAQFHAARASAKPDSDSSPIASVASAPTPAAAPEPAPAPAPAAGGWRSRTAAAAQTAVSTPAPVTTAAPTTSGKSSWRDREAAKSTASVGPSSSGLAAGAPVVSRGPAPALTQESFPTLGGASSTGPKPVVPKASAWGKVEAVKPSAASIVGGYAAAAKPATATVASAAAAAAAAPVTATELGVEFEKLKFTPTLHVTSAQYNAKMEDEIKNLLELQSTAALVRALQSLGGTREQLTGLVYRLMSLGLDLTDDAKRPFVDTALVELLEARVLGRDNVVDGIADIVGDMDSLICDVPKAVQYLTVMLRSVVDRKVFPTYELPESVAKAMGVTVDPVAAAAAKAARDAAYGEEDDDDDDYDYYDDVDDEDALQSSLGLTNKNTKAKNKHKRDAE